MNARHLLVAVGVGNTSALLFVVGGRALRQGPAAELPFDLLVGRVLPLGLLVGVAIALGTHLVLDGVGRRLRPALGAYTAPGFAVPAAAAAREAGAAVIPPLASIEVAILGVASASAMYVLVWFAEGPDVPEGTS